MRQGAQGLTIAVTPGQVYTANVIDREGDLTVDSHGNISGQIRIVMSGQSALYWRQAALEEDADEVKKQFDRGLNAMVPNGVEAHVSHFLGMNQPDVNLLAIVNVKGILGAPTAKLLLLPGFFFETRGNVPFAKEAKRLTPVDMKYADSVVNEITYELPQGMTVEGAPQDATNLWKGHAIYVTKTTKGAGEITISRTLESAFTFAKASEYQDLRGFYQKVATTDQQDMVLTGATAGKGD
ncbi:MAG: hypothetical protein ACRD27_01635 [Terracidiphilus sp.]